MKGMAAAVKTISGMFKDPATYKASEFKWAADTIRDKSGSALSAHFASEAASPQSKAGRTSSKSATGSTASQTIWATTPSRGCRRGEKSRTDARQHAHEA
jgi:cytochrome c556